MSKIPISFNCLFLIFVLSQVSIAIDKDTLLSEAHQRYVQKRIQKLDQLVKSINLKSTGLQTSIDLAKTQVDTNEKAIESLKTEIKEEKEKRFWTPLSVFVTAIAVIIALLRKWILSRLLPPKLGFRLLSQVGETGQENTILGQLIDVRNFHLTISNSRRSSPADNVQLFLTGLEKNDSQGKHIPWQGNTPIQWRDQNNLKGHDIFRIIGSDSDCDLCVVKNLIGAGIQQVVLELCPMAKLNNLDRFKLDNAGSLIAFLQIRSRQKDFSVVQVTIEWNGQWLDSDANTQQNIKISVKEN